MAREKAGKSKKSGKAVPDLQSKKIDRDRAATVKGGSLPGGTAVPAVQLPGLGVKYGAPRADGLIEEVAIPFRKK